MACTNITLKGLAQDCEANVGGVKNVFIAEYYPNAATIESGGQQGAQGYTGKIALSVSADTASGTTAYLFKHYYFRKGAASMTSTLNVDAANGTNYVSTELALTFAKQDTNKRIEMSTLVLGDVMVVVEDGNGRMWFLGKDEPVIATAGGAATGQAKGDANNYTLTLTDEAETFPYELNSASTSAFRALVGTSAT